MGKKQIPKLSIKAEIDKEKAAKSSYDAELHKHPPGQCGASSLRGSCNLLAAYKMAGIELPDMDEFKASTDALEVSSERHESRQNDLRGRYEREPIPYVCSEGEVYVRHEIVPPITQEPDNDEERNLCALGMVGVSPIDWAYVQVENEDGKGGFVDEEIQFRNKSEWLPVKAAEAEWHQIVDFKFPGDYGYHEVILKKKVELEKLGLPAWKALEPKYQAQGHFYMIATGLKEITFYFEHKEKGWSFEIVLPWMDEVWKAVQETTYRRMQLADSLLRGEDIDITEDDLACIAKLNNEDGDLDAIPWYSCPFSDTRVEESQRTKNKMVIKLNRYCEWANAFLLIRAKNQFLLMSTWKRGKSHITIMETNWEKGTIVCQNKSGKLYEDSYIYALRSYKPR